eukprot:sb/3472629/
MLLQLCKLSTICETVSNFPTSIIRSIDNKARAGDKKGTKQKRGINLKSAFSKSAKDPAIKESKDAKKKEDKAVMKDKKNSRTPQIQRRSEGPSSMDIKTHIDTLITSYEKAEGRDKEEKAAELKYVLGRLSTVFSPQEDPSAVAAERTANRILALVQEKLGHS